MTYESQMARYRRYMNKEAVIIYSAGVVILLVAVFGLVGS